MNEITLPPLTDAEKNELALVACCRNLHDNFLKLGELLVENETCAHWSANSHESFKELVEMLGLSYSFATRLMGIARLVTSQLLSKEEVLEMGVSKACLLLPRAKDGIDEETKAIAISAPYQELRKHLKHDIKDVETSEYLLCPRCAFRIDFHKGLLRR